jgi:FKBP-type peptidyl-prolyl cis-trans isomerase 2
MKTVEVGNNVKVHYVGTLADGTEFDNSRTRGKAMEVKVGITRLIPAFTDALVGMTEGETKDISLSPEEGYGPRYEEAIQAVPMAAFGPDFKFIVGETVQGNGPQGPFLATIHALEEEAKQVMVDTNHPLAGKHLKFQIEMLEIGSETNTDTDTTTETTETETTTTESDTTTTEGE